MPDITSISWWRERTTKMGKFFGWGCLAIFGLPLVIGFGWNQYSGQNNHADSSLNVVVAKINGEAITKSQMQSYMSRNSGNGADYAYSIGGAVEQRIRSSAITQLAKKYNIKVSDTDIDRSLAEEKTKNVGPKATDNEWQDYVMKAHGMTTSDYRDAIAKSPAMLAEGLMVKYKSMENVNADEVKAQNDEVQLRTILINSGKSMFNPNKKELSDEQAKKLADDLYAKVKGGADFAATAKGVSTDLLSKDGTKSATYVNEARSLAQYYGKEYAEVVKKTAKGQLTPVAKSGGFQKGYAFSFVEDRKNTPPKDYDPKKAMDALKTERVNEKLRKEMDDIYNATPIEFTKDGQDYKAYFDNLKLAMDQQKLQSADQAKMMGQDIPANLPTQASIDAKKKLVDSELEALYNRHKDESTPAILFIPILKKRLAVATGDQKKKDQAELIAAYETALKGAEDQEMRFELGDLYRDTNQAKMAISKYQEISHYVDLAPGFDLKSKQDEQLVRTKLINRFTTVKLDDESKKQQAKYDKLTPEIEAETAKAKAAQAQQPGMSTNFGRPGAQRK